jgi:hypothetical protein
MHTVEGMEDRNNHGEKDRETYLRWQEFAIAQLGYTINLMMTLSGAILAFAVKENLAGRWKAHGCEWLSALACLGGSVVVAITANVTRAIDFRYTRRAVRERMKDGKDHQEFHDIAECLGSWTWRLFYFQAATFAFGIVLLAHSLSAFID